MHGMSMMNALIGAAGKMPEREVAEFQSRVCIGDEEIEAAFKTKRDSYVFTDRRLIVEDVKGMFGKKRSLLSIPYSKVSAFEVETAGLLDTDGELRVWISGFHGPASIGNDSHGSMLKLEFRGNQIDVYVIQALLANKVK